MPNFLENAGFENGLKRTFAHWRGWYLDTTEGAVCVYLKKPANPKTGFYQDIPGSRFKRDGMYKFQMKLLSPTANATVSPTVWKFYKNQKVHTQETFKLQVGKWQIIQIDTRIKCRLLKKVRAELYFGPDNAEIIIQRAYLGK
jgi:hypothetical protein